MLSVSLWSSLCIRTLDGTGKEHFRGIEVVKKHLHCCIANYKSNGLRLIFLIIIYIHVW